MADGTTKPIEEVQVGDQVLATDPETGEEGTREVLATILGSGTKTLVEITVDTAVQLEVTDVGHGVIDEALGRPGPMVLGDVIIATDGHPFWSPELDAWIDAIDLVPGMWLLSSEDTLVQVTGVQTWSQSSTVHNLTVQGIHTCHVLVGETPVLVSNSGGPCSRALDETYKSASTPAKLEHVIDPQKHGFDGLVARSGGREQAMRRIVDSLGDANDLPSAGRFEVNRVIDNDNLTIRSAVVRGVPMIGTAFILINFLGENR